MTPEELAPLVSATVVDIRAPAARLTTSYLVDTNVLFFCYYQRHSQHIDLGLGPLAYQTTSYPKYEKRVRESRGRLAVARSCVVEFLHTIERAELKILHAILNPQVTPGQGDPLKPKEIRGRGYLEGRLDQVRYQVQTHLAVLQANFNLLPDPQWDRPFLDCLREEWSRGLIDATDAALIAEARAAGIVNIISDDAELSTVSDICLYTANRTATDAARQAGKLA